MRFDVENPLLLVPRLSVPPAAVVRFPGPPGAVSPTYLSPQKIVRCLLGPYLSNPRGKGGLRAWGRLLDPLEKRLGVHNETRNVGARR